MSLKNRPKEDLTDAYFGIALLLVVSAIVAEWMYGEFDLFSFRAFMFFFSVAFISPFVWGAVALCWPTRDDDEDEIEEEPNESNTKLKKALLYAFLLLVHIGISAIAAYTVYDYRPSGDCSVQYDRQGAYSDC